MPAPWNAERHERLLKAIVLNFSMNTATLASAYNAQLAKNTEDKLTKGAIDQHFTKLVAGMGKAGKKTVMQPKTPTKLSTPRAAAVKAPAPTSSAKKRKADRMSDEEEEEGESSEDDVSEGISAPLAPRTPSSRASKAARLDAGAAGSMEGIDVADMTNEGEDDIMFQHELNFDGVGEVKPLLATATNGKGPDTFTGGRAIVPSKKLIFDSGDDSDISEWEP
ncbi:hypothetical protein BDY17DRAFT_129818 [Neohortaea acidophila]|uniref:Uncharacterized protein n=1 Tax=Neohortaea acidophila TaxID=245834 RepID=A0A6A6PXS0_9PEZI|nr:uncharacterized protein BDY17DRAFT_129818 [Neohortaea acidophila]KAF2484499.1 hypothetical protein BDY17DRAFT_129818 [Neohortaea acidophila]